MLATKGRLKVALLGYCGVLVVGLGMYGAFHPKQAEADGPWPFYNSVGGHGYKWQDMSSDTISGTCSYCGSSTTIHRTRVREECWNTQETYHWIIGWHHRHFLSIKWARYYWRLDSVTCSNSSCGG